MEFTMNGTSGPTVNVAAVTKKTMGMLFKADPTMKIKAKAEYEGTIEKLSEFPTTNKNFIKFFEVEEDKWNNRTKVFVGMTVEISTDLDNLKHQNRSELMNKLQENNIWLKKNTFKTMKATTIGFQYMLHVGSVWRPDLQGKMRQYLEQQHPGVEIPQFVIQNGRPRVPDYNGKKYSMNALLVICSVEDAEELSKLMMTTKFPQGQCGRFSPIRIKEKSILPRIAMAQNTFEQSARTVAVLGVHDECLHGPMLAGTDSTMSDEEDTTKETLEEVLMRQAVDENGKQMILSIERTIKSDSRGKWNFICGDSDTQDRVEQFLEKNLEHLYAQSANVPSKVTSSFGRPRVSGGDLRSVAASYVSALTDLPELASSEDDEQISATISRAPKRIKGRSIMVEASSDTIYAGKPRETWASKVKTDETTVTKMTSGTAGTDSSVNGNTEPKSVVSAEQSTLTGHTKQDIVLANRLESYQRESEKQSKEMKKSIEMLKQKLVDTEARMDQQADVLSTMLETNMRLVNEKIDLVDQNNGLRLDRLERNIELMMTHMGVIAPAHHIERAKLPSDSPARKRKNKRTTPQRKEHTRNNLDVSMENNSFGIFAADDENEEDDNDDNTENMLASDEEVATIPGYGTPDSSSSESDDSADE
jgi:hypothetical protein